MSQRVSRMRCLIGALAVAMSGLLVGCQTGHLPNTKIDASDENREVYRVVMAYRSAMEARDVDAILELVSPNYYENGGTTETDEDDYGYDELRDKVAQLLSSNVLAVRYHILLTEIDVSGDRASADYEYRAQFKFMEGEQEGWAQQSDFNRLDLVREDAGWKIVAGL